MNKEILTLGQSIQYERKKKGITQKKLAKYLGISDSSLRYYESNEISPKPETLKNICSILNITVSQLMANIYNQIDDLNDFERSINYTFLNYVLNYFDYKLIFEIQKYKIVYNSKFIMVTIEDLIDLFEKVTYTMNGLLGMIILSNNEIEIKPKSINNSSCIGSNIKNIRIKLNITQKELAEKANISLRALNYYECGTYTPNNDTLNKIANVLETDISEFLEYNYSSFLENVLAHFGFIKEDFTENNELKFNLINKRFNTGVVLLDKQLNALEITLKELVGSDIYDKLKNKNWISIEMKGDD